MQKQQLQQKQKAKKKKKKPYLLLPGYTKYFIMYFSQ